MPGEELWGSKCSELKFSGQKIGARKYRGRIVIRKVGPKILGTSESNVMYHERITGYQLSGNNGVVPTVVYCENFVYSVIENYIYRKTSIHVWEEFHEK